jgi:hypothetical protein
VGRRNVPAGLNNDDDTDADANRVGLGAVNASARSSWKEESAEFCMKDEKASNDTCRLVGVVFGVVVEVLMMFLGLFRCSFKAKTA